MPVGAFGKSLIHLVDSRRNGAEIRFSGQAVLNLPPVSADVGSAPTGSFQAESSGDQRDYARLILRQALQASLTEF